MPELGLVKKLPEIINAASKNLLSLLVLVILLVFILAMSFFSTSADSVKILIFLVLFSCVIILALLILKKYEVISDSETYDREPAGKPWMYYVLRIFSWGLLIYLVHSFSFAFNLKSYYTLFVYINVALFIPISTLIVTLMTPITPRIALSITLLNNIIAISFPFLDAQNNSLYLSIGINHKASLTPLYASGTAMLVNLVLVVFANMVLIRKRC